jgi:hypothetical protein
MRISRNRESLLVVFAVLGGVLLSSSTPVRCDTIWLHGGAEFQCFIHGETDRPERTFSDDPQKFIEFKAGSVTFSIPRSRVLRWALDDKYVQPAKGSDEEKRVTDYVKTVLAEKSDGTEPSAVSELLVGNLVYLANFAKTGRERDLEGLPVRKGDSIATNQWLEIRPNSRATLDIGDRIRAGLKDRSRIQLGGMKHDTVGNRGVYEVELDLLHGKAWLEIRNLQTSEQVALKVSGWRFEVKQNSLLSFEGRGAGEAREFRMSYWRGDNSGSLRVVAPEIPGGGFYIDIGRTVLSDRSTETGVQTSAVDAPDLKEWEQWEEFRPVEFNLSFKVVLPVMQGFPSEGLAYGLRENLGIAALPPQEIIIVDLIQTIGTCQKGLDAYNADLKRYPTIEEGLKTLFENPGYEGWKGPYVGEGTPLLDWWQLPLRYRLIGEEGNRKGFVYSSGPNKIDDMGLGDDVW